MSRKSKINWKWVKAQYRSGQVSNREICREHFAIFEVKLAESTIRKKVAAEGWEKDLQEEVTKGIRNKLVRSAHQKSAQRGAQGPHAASDPAEDKEIIEAAVQRGVDVVISHRDDIRRMHAFKTTIMDRLHDHLHGVEPDETLPALLGRHESLLDALEKLSRIQSRLIPLERQAYNLKDDPIEPETDEDVDLSDVSTEALREMAEAIDAQKANAQ